MSLFGSATSASGPPGGGSLFPSLTPLIDPSGKRKSIFDPSTTSSNQTQTQSGLFGGAGATTSAPTPSLFGTAPTATSSASFNLGNPSTSSAAPFTLGKPPTTTSNPTPFSFGASTTSSAPSGGLFGPTTSAAAASSGLFGNVGNTGQNTTTSGFGTSSNAAPNTSSIFGNAGQSTAETGQSVQQPAPNSQPSNRDPAYFSSLLERQKKKARLSPLEQNGRPSPLPTLNMDLGDLARRAQEIGSRGSQNVTGIPDSRAHYLLAGSGVSPGKAYREFQALDGDAALPESTASPLDFSTESSAYLTDLRTKGREAMMRESMDRVYREVDAFIEQSLGIDFEEQKLRIMEHFGLLPKEDESVDDAKNSGQTGSFGRSSRKGNAGFAQSKGGATRSVFGRSAMDKSIIGTPGSVSGTASFFKKDTTSTITGGLLRGQTARDLRDKERLFVEQVEKLNAARLKESKSNVMQMFGQAEKSATGESPRQLADAYEALQEIGGENSTSTGIRERQYADAYLSDNGTQQAAALRKQILNGSRSYLENAFYKELENTVEKNPREAQLGGRPSVTNKVRAYIRVRAARRDLAPDGAELQQIGENGDYCWILIFYLLRCGFVKEAAEYVNNDVAFQSTDRRFVSYMTMYSNTADRRLSRKLQEMIEGEYQQRAKIAPKNTVDPYRMACYKIVGRCDLSSRNLETIGQGVEDWLWLQFSLAREADRFEELSGEIFGLAQIRETVAEIGQKHFQKGQVEGSSAYGTYFLMQILAGMFEQAVDYLHTFNPVSAVHFAIALAYYGLLRVSDFTVAGTELLTFSTSQQPLLNFVPLVAHYTATFRTALPVAAVDYLALICLNLDKNTTSLNQSQINACHECLRELCLETREFAKLLGDIRSDGSRIAGAIELRAPLIKLDTHEEFLKSITRQAAAVADQRGQVADAVLLYHLCEDYDNVVSVLNRALADAITLDLGESPLQLQPLKPRRQNGQQGSVSSAQGEGPISSLSLTQSTSSPVELAKNMISLYNDNAAYYNLISATNRETCGALLRLLSARAQLEAHPPQYMTALEELNDLNILPLRANGDIPSIRAAAAAFGALPQLVARCAGVSVVWAVKAIGGERDNLVNRGSWEAGFGGDKDAMKEQLSHMAKDLMIFAGLVKYKLPGRVYDMLTRAGGDVGGY